jgi:hypothetical protein
MTTLIEAADAPQHGRGDAMGRAGASLARPTAPLGQARAFAALARVIVVLTPCQRSRANPPFDPNH